MTAARYGVASKPYGTGKAKLWCVWTAPPYHRAPDVAGLAHDHADPVKQAQAALRECGLMEARRRDELADAIRAALPKSADLWLVVVPAGTVRLAAPPAPKGPPPACELPPREKGTGPARIGVVKLHGQNAVIGHFWCAWKRAPFSRAPDFAGACGLGIHALAVAREALGADGQTAVLNDALANAVLRGLFVANAMPVPSPGQRTRIDAPAPAPVMTAATCDVDGDSVWCVWFGKPEGRPARLGYIEGDRFCIFAMSAVGRHTLPVVRWYGAELARAWVSEAMKAERTRADSSERPHPRAGFSPVPWRSELGLPTTGTVTRAQLVAAWRRRASATHPDAGGEASAFVKAREAYEAGLREVTA